LGAAGATAAGFGATGFGAAGFGVATTAGFFAGVFLGAAFAAGLRFAAVLRAADDLRVAARRGDFRAAVFLRAEALVVFLRDAAVRFALRGFLDFFAFAMIDLPIPVAILNDAFAFRTRSNYYF
jgi:hypothetical protein